MTTKPLLHWVGSKAWAVDSILPLINKQIRPGALFVEPFAGSAALTLNVPHPHRLLSDSCGALINFYLQLQRHPIELWATFSLMVEDWAGKEKFYQLRAVYNDIHSEAHHVCDLQCAALFFFLARTCFNTIWRTNKLGRFNAPFGDRIPRIKKEHFFAVSSALASVSVLHCDWREALEEVPPGSVVYADPPYEDTAATYGGAWPHSEHFALAARLHDLARQQVSIILSQPDLPTVRTRYADFTLVELTRKRGYIVGGLGKRKAARELLFIK